MKIVVAEKVSSAGLELLKAEQWDVVQPAGKDELYAALADADALIVRSAVKVTAELLSRAPALRVVGRAGVGVDNVDLEAATRQGVLVMNTPGGNAVSVAEHTLALMLALARAIPQANQSIKEGRWEKKQFMGRELRQKTLGIIGLGRIGVEVSKRARALDMMVLAYDPYVTPVVAGEAGAELVGRERLLQESDYISLHVSLTPETAGMIDAAAIAKMKPGVRIINCSRGELIEEAALAEAIRAGTVAGAALDVFAKEPPPPGHPLATLPQVLATPHIAGSTEEAQEIVGSRIAEQIREYLKSGMIINAVNVPAPSPEEYRNLKPYLQLGERLGAFIAQIAQGRLRAVHIGYSGKLAQMNTNLLRNSALQGILNRVLDEKANMVNAAAIAADRGIAVEESRGPRTGFADSILVSMNTDAGGASAEGMVLHGQFPRLLAVDGIHIEAPLAGNLVFFKNQDVPGVIGRIGTLLGQHKVNIANFSLGRAEAAPAGGGPAEALAVVHYDGPRVSDSLLQELSQSEAVRFVRAVDIG
ncbi:MAG: phosphoglycerate dehydrogenase [Acidobacteria bacterium]|nr:phosphoglycerate dehydrogenase [Acidobacteriota bacterium]